MDQSLIRDCQDHLRDIPKNKGECYTSFYKGNSLSGTKLEKPIVSFYEELISNCTKDLGLHHITNYNVSMWMQMYDHTTKGHETHSHFGGSQFISWVHFLQAPDQKCFYFIDSYGNKHYPDHQKEFDFIAFPSWALHGVDKVEDTDITRTVTAGNICIYRYGGIGGLDAMSSNFQNTTLWIVNQT
jgi:hypothetical protein|tara:strand:+ start:284 stop:838 length:555 start_codon:yes stop_codon:yes gene_type:complete